jgi:ribosomal protein S18 acetylase RimI-like enzyme
MTIKRLQVQPELQGQGIGSALLRAMDSFAASLGLEQLHLTVRGGTGRESWYEREGYKVVATIPGAIRVQPGDDRDEIYMVKELAD